MRAKEFIDEDVVPFPSASERGRRLDHKTMSDEEKYELALVNQDIDKMVANMDYDTPGSDTGLSMRDVDSMDLSPKGMALSRKELDKIMKNAGIRPLPNINDVDEGNKENAEALVGSGRADPHGKKTNPDSKAHKAVRTPGTGPNARTKYNHGAKPGANPGFVGG